MTQTSDSPKAWLERAHNSFLSDRLVDTTGAAPLEQIRLATACKECGWMPLTDETSFNGALRAGEAG